MRINKNILVIDDDVHIRRVLELKLKNAGYQVLVAEDGEVGMEMINTKLPDAVITDVEMPKKNGVSIVKEVNKSRSEHPLLILIVSCSIGFEEHQWIDEMQDTYFMEKPFSPNKILERIDEYFEIQR